MFDLYPWLEESIGLVGLGFILSIGMNRFNWTDERFHLPPLTPTFIIGVTDIFLLYAGSIGWAVAICAPFILYVLLIAANYLVHRYARSITSYFQRLRS